MTDYQSKLVNMPDRDLDYEIHNVLSDIRDIADATGSTFTIIVTPDKEPVLIRDGNIEVSA